MTNVQIEVCFHPLYNLYRIVYSICIVIGSIQFVLQVLSSTGSVLELDVLYIVYNKMPAWTKSVHKPLPAGSTHSL